MKQKEQRGRIGLSVGDDSTADSLGEVLQHAGYTVTDDYSPDRLDLTTLQQPHVDAWVVVPPEDNDAADRLEGLLKRAGVRYHLEARDAIALFGESYIHWQGRLVQDLVNLMGKPRPEPEITYSKPTPAPGGTSGASMELLVLASSLGGPPAVKAFLDALAPGLPFAMVYAQHIEAEQLDSLVRVLARHSHYRLERAQAERAIAPGTVTLVPVAERLDLTKGGIFRDPGAPWSGPYRPCLDEVIDAAAGAFGRRTGVVVFSGMGEDGSAAAGRLEQLGGRVWAQDAASSGCSSMPDAVRARCVRAYSGSPTALASNISLQFAGRE